MTTCPKCRYTRKPEDTAPDYECPQCGVIYAKVARPNPNPDQAPSTTRSEPVTTQPVKPAPAPAPVLQPPANPEPTRPPIKTEPAPPRCKECSGRISPRASLCPHCGEPLSASRSLAVAVRDIEMPIGSMVNFMVKWAIASIPAIILIMLIMIVPLIFLGSIFKAAGN